MSGLQRAQRRIAPRAVPGRGAAHSQVSARPRIGSARARMPRAEGVTLPALWRLLAFCACAAILAGGVLMGFHFSNGPQAQVVQEDPRRLAVKVASILGSLPVPEPPRAEPGPTAADFARPAFLEPMATRIENPGTMPADPAPAPTAEPQVAALDVAPPPAAPLPAAPLPPQRPAASSERTARIVFDVTMRSGPRRGASAIGQVDKNTRVTVIACKSWCEVVSGGKRGYVYRRAVDRES